MNKKVMLRFFTFLLLLILSLGELRAQDPQFTQYYSAPIYLNPAFTGATRQHRAAINYRNHWSSLPRAFVTYAFSYDYNIKDSPSSVGLIAVNDRAGTASLQSTSIGATYSYRIPITNGLQAVPSLQVGYTMQSLDYSKLVFADQLQFGNPNAPSTDPALRNLENVNHFDFATGVLVYNKRFWGGVAVHHLNRPNQSVLEEESMLPMRFSVHAGYKIPIDLGPFRNRMASSINPSFQYRQQGRFNQLDVGLSYFYRMLMLGVWYRGLPIQQDMPRTINHDALAVAFGVSINGFSFGYSYDLTVSKLGPASSGGSHEISLALQFSTKAKPGKVSRKVKQNPCPAFMPNYLWKP
ncbi:PorP/SprF family type IX secretion system membrane protein [Tunicatimonas pelagia]|uniref:PorP/SprF family type IX secretion system membrane protein n=1 Tax=Tunicatimonas pelagia TaxID=931531 RepID=UPI002664FD60|nr:type IX secretion system membrane protein PorP/SprF [Tunicatimonas pelagia]WKN40545.1 type IX secretion system membrane protein PorP/SprF [Tunicatimonas pelagia]